MGPHNGSGCRVVPASRAWLAVWGRTRSRSPPVSREGRATTSTPCRCVSLSTLLCRSCSICGDSDEDSQGLDGQCGSTRPHGVCASSAGNFPNPLPWFQIPRRVQVVFAEPAGRSQRLPDRLVGPVEAKDPSSQVDARLLHNHQPEPWPLRIQGTSGEDWYRGNCA